MDKLSYAWGMAMGQQLKGMGVEKLEFDSYVGGIKAAFGEGKPEMEAEEAHKLINEYLQQLQDKLAAASKEAAKKFLDENRGKEGVKETPSGLQLRRRARECVRQQPTRLLCIIRASFSTAPCLTALSTVANLLLSLSTA